MTAFTGDSQGLALVRHGAIDHRQRQITVPGPNSVKRAILLSWRGIIAFATLLGIIYMPVDVAGLSAAYPGLIPFLTSVTQFQLLGSFAFLMVTYVLGRDLLPLIRRWRNDSLKHPLALQSQVFAEWEQILTQ